MANGEGGVDFRGVNSNYEVGKGGLRSGNGRLPGGKGSGGAA